jgi:hypothetical protein
MPFTISHTAAVILLSRRRLVTSALVIGTMTPDLAYFCHLEGFNRAWGHTMGGFFIFCLPVGLIILFGFHKFLKTPLFALLPSYHQQRLLPYLQDLPYKSWRAILKSLVSLGIGTLSHLAWDSFTHSHGFIVANVVALHQPVAEIAGGKIFVFSILQHGSTVLGLAAVVLWYLGWCKKTLIHPYRIPISLQLPPTTRVVILAVMAGGFFFLGLLIAFLRLPDSWTLHLVRKMAERFAIISMFVISMEIVLYCVIWHLFLFTGRYSRR